MSLLIKGAGATGGSLAIKVPAVVRLLGGDGRPALGVIYLYTEDVFGDGITVNFDKWKKLNEKAYLTKADGTPLYYYIEGDETLTTIYVYPLESEEEDIILVLNDIKGAGMRNNYYDVEVLDKRSPFTDFKGGFYGGVGVATIPLYTVTLKGGYWGDREYSPSHSTS